jgi:hypothetical protein
MQPISPISISKVPFSRGPCPSLRRPIRGELCSASRRRHLLHLPFVSPQKDLISSLATAAIPTTSYFESASIRTAAHNSSLRIARSITDPVTNALPLPPPPLEHCWTWAAAPTSTQIEYDKHRRSSRLSYCNHDVVMVSLPQRRGQIVV